MKEKRKGIFQKMLVFLRNFDYSINRLMKENMKKGRQVKEKESKKRANSCVIFKRRFQ